MNSVFIYALKDPDPSAIRYLGKAADPYRRYEQHVECFLKDKTHKGNWIRSLLAAGKNPILEVLDEVPENAWEFWEREYIRWGRVMLLRLTNGTDGGEGGRMPPETLVRMRAANLGRKRSPKFCAQNGLHHLGRKKNPDERANMRAAALGRVVRPETGAKIRAVKLGKKLTLEHCTAISAGRMGIKFSAEHIANMRGKKRSPEARANMRAAALRRAKQ